MSQSRLCTTCAFLLTPSISATITTTSTTCMPCTTTSNIFLFFKKTEKIERLRPPAMFITLPTIFHHSYRHYLRPGLHYQDYPLQQIQNPRAGISKRVSFFARLGDKLRRSGNFILTQLTRTRLVEKPYIQAKEKKTPQGYLSSHVFLHSADENSRFPPACPRSRLPMIINCMHGGLAVREHLPT